MSRQPDLKALVHQIGEQAIAPTHDSLAHRARLYGDVAPVSHRSRRVIYERELTHLFGRRTWERFTIDLDDSGELP